MTHKSVKFINGKTTLLPKKVEENLVGHNFSILVVSDFILSDCKRINNELTANLDE